MRPSDAGWVRAHERFHEFLVRVGASDVHLTRTIALQAFPVTGEGLPSRIKQWGSTGTWIYLSHGDSDTGDGMALAQPVTAGAPQSAVYVFPLIEIHSRLVAWWLTSAWRARELADAAQAAARSGSPLTAAALVRPLLETAAATWDDGRLLHSQWDTVKQSGDPTDHEAALRNWLEYAGALNDVQFGGKFTDEAVAQNALAGLLERKNVMTSLKRLARALGSGDVQTDYQWLCNTVHPSLGNTFVFGFNPDMHASGTHAIREFVDRAPAFPDHHTRSESVVQDATRRAGEIALSALEATLDASLRFIDDLGLTTGAPRLAIFDYWRALAPADRNDACPCRSGKKAKRCRHEWGEAAPAFPHTFELTTPDSGV